MDIGHGTNDGITQPGTTEPGTSQPGTGPVLVISCDTCIMQNTGACDDCMMNCLCDDDRGAVVLSLQELREVRLLAKSGLVPTLRHRAVG